MLPEMIYRNISSDTLLYLLPSLVLVSQISIETNYATILTTVSDNPLTTGLDLNRT